MKKVAILILLLLISSCAKQIRIREIGPKTQLPCIEEPSNVLRVGEKLLYDVDWIGIPSGNITLEIKEITQVEGHSVYHIIATTVPNKFFRLFYNVEYSMHTYVDTKELKPIRFYKKKIYNGNLSEEEIEFSSEGGSVRWQPSKANPKQKLRVSGDVQDMLSAVYSFRTKEIVSGKTYPINVIYKGRMWLVDVILENVREVDLGSLGKFNTVLAKFSTNLNMEVTGFNDLKVYFSVDKKRLPILFKLHTKIGYITGALSSNN